VVLEDDATGADLDYTGSGGVKVHVLAGANGFNVLAFGAVGNATTDCSATIRAAVRAAVRYTGLTSPGDPTGAVYAPAGVYRMTENGVFSDFNAVKRQGIAVNGDGPGNTIFWLDPSALSGATWFYDNGATNRAWNMTFRDVSFRGGDTWRILGLGYDNFDANCNGFKFTGPGWESAHVFDNVEFAFIDTVLEAAGANNADVIRFNNCTATKCRRANFINNEQSMGITWSQCYLSNHFGPVLEYGAVAGGGNFNFDSGSIIQTPDTFGGGTSALVLCVAGGPTAANAPIRFSGTRVESRGQGSIIGTITGASPIVILDGCSLLSTASTTRKMATIGNSAALVVKNTSFSKEAAGDFEWELTSSARLGKNASILFEDCYLPRWDDDTITITNGRGKIVTERCWQAIADYTVEPFVRETNGSIVGSTVAADTASRAVLSRAANPLRGGSLPLTTGSDSTIALPRGAFLSRVRCVLPAGAAGATGSTYRLIIGDNAKSVTYATGPTGAQDAGFVLDQSLNIKLGDALVDRTIRIWADDGAGGTSGAGSPSPSFFVVEWF
jgi:hypothetical protein